jgi:putative exosortase-associated protein (TIGR04073 family)
MKWMKFASLAALIVMLTAGTAHAGADEVYRQQTDASKMMHKLGRGVVNVFTCWVEVPRNIAIEWEKTDPATGFVMGFVKGFGWGFARFATGVYETFTCLLPVPENYEPMLEPEFVVTDVWGDPIPGFDEAPSTVKADHPLQGPVYPQRFTY